jgi:hypothetical protein
MIPVHHDQRDFCHQLVSSELDTRLVRAHFPLADMVISNAVDICVISRLKKWICKLQQQPRPQGQNILRTEYYLENRVFTVDIDMHSKKRQEQYQIRFRNDYRVYCPSPLSDDTASTVMLEYAGENRFPLKEFQCMKDFHHERQSFIQRYPIEGAIIEMSYLIPGISSPESSKINELFSNLLLSNNTSLEPEPEHSPSPWLSVSFTVYFNKGVSRDLVLGYVSDIYDYVKGLQKI